jgi:CRP-like cAMP-binding protein
MIDFIQFSNRLSLLNKEATEDLSGKLQSKTFQKGDYLLKEESVCKHLYFIDKGLTKTFFNNDGKEFIMRFFPENTMFTVLNSYLMQTPSNYMIMALEPTTVTCILQTELEALCQKHHCLETFFRKLVSFASLNMMRRISEMLEENATESYNHFVKENGPLLQRISLGDLACYLGITQVSLSRIRAKK